MLKPKRKTFRKEMERDPFLDSILSAKSFIDKNKKRYIKIIGLGIAAVLVFMLYSQNQVSHQDAAESTLSKGMMYLDHGDEQNAMIHLQEVVDEFSSTSAGKTAGYYIGKIHYDRENYNLAQPYFENYVSNGDNILLIGAASQAMVNIFLSNGNIEDAIRYQKRAIDKANSKVEGAFASIRLAEIYINDNNPLEGEAILNNLLTDYEGNFEVRQKIDQVFGLIQAGK